MLFREIVSVQSGVKKQYFEVKAGGTYSVNCVVKEQQNFVSFFTCTLGHPLPVSLSDGTIKCCQTFEHVFSLRTKLRDEGNNVTCEVLPTDCASSAPPSMLREFQTAAKRVVNFRDGVTGLHMEL
jgi:hypothetical protein